MALLLRKQGIKRIRPLLGGLDGWREAGFALQAVSIEQRTHVEFTESKS